MKKYSIILSALFILISLTLSAQKSDKYLKRLDKIDAMYEEGDYDKAISHLDKKFYAKVTKKLGMENKYIPMYYLRQAKFNWALGVVVGFEDFIANALSSSIQFYGENTVDHALNQLEVAESYILYGNFVKAKEMVTNAQKTLNKAGNNDKRYDARVNLALIEILVGQGYYTEALTKIDEDFDYFKGRATEKESYVDDNGALQTRRLTEKQVSRRFKEYASIQTLKAQALAYGGNIDEGWLAFEKARDWMLQQKSFVSQSSLEYILNQFYFANFKIETGLDPDELEKRLHKEENYLRILTNLKRSHEESHYLAFDIYEELIKQYLIANQLSRYRSFSDEYEKAIKKNFPKNSLNYINIATLEFNSRLTRERTNNLEDRANSILTNIQTLPKYHEKRIDVLDFLFRISIKNRKFNDAEKYLTDILEIKAGLYGKDAPKYHLAKLNLANFYVDYTDKIADAEKIYNESFYGVIKKEITPIHAEYITVLNHLAKLSEFKDEYAKAQEFLDEALKVSLEKYRDPTDTEYAKELEKVASLQISIGDYDGARENINKVIEIYDDKKLDKDEYNSVYYIMALETQARLLGIEGYFAKAEDNIEDAKDMLFKAKTLEGYNELATEDQLAELNIYLGKYNETGKQLDELIAAYEEIYGPNSGKLVNALINKGRLEMLLGMYSEAETVIERAQGIAVTVFGDQSTANASAQLLLGELYTNIGDYEKAIQLIESAIAIEEDKFGRNHIRVALALSQLGIAKYYEGAEVEVTEEILLEARQIIGDKLSNQNPRYADVSTNLAKIYISANKPNDAIASLSLAESIWLGITGRRGTRNNVNVGKINALVGDVYYSTRNYAKAEEFYDKAKSNFQKTLNDKHPEYVKVLSKLSKVYYMEGDGKRAKTTMEEALGSYEEYIKKYFKTLSEREKAKFWNTIRPDFEFYNTLAFKYSDIDKDAIGKVYNNALLTKALLLSSSIKIRERILNSGDEELISKYNEWLSKKDNMTRVLSLSAEQMEQNGINISRLNAEIEDIEKELSKRSDAFSSDLEESNITWENVREALKDNEVAIEMVRYRYFDHVFTDSVIYATMYVQNSKEQKKPEVILLNNGYDLENRNFSAYRNSIIYQIEDTKSYGEYWEPIVAKIGNLNTIYLSPDGVYNQINLEAIPTGDGKYIIDNSNIVLISNTKDIYLKQQKPEQKAKNENIAMMFGNPEYYLEANASGSVSPLPGTQREVEALRRLLNKGGVPSDYFTQGEATEQQIKSLNSPNILHIATHGFFTAEIQSTDDMELNETEAAKNPLLRTGLIMTGGGDLLSKTTFNYNMENGILTAYEAMNLSLDQTDLVVLSACETGLGKMEFGEGVYGLQRAFLVAGAKTLIMSMFKVDDVATQKLMEKFYQKWLDTGNKRQAFIDAKKELRVEYQDPIYWGAFIMMGID